MSYELHCGDCLEILPTLPPQSIDAVIADIPYGTTACKWDSVIPFAPMWECIKHVIKPKGAVVLFGSQPFTSALVMSNPKWYRYGWVWEKEQGSNFLDARRKPYKVHEDISVFGDGLPPYNPIYTQGKPYVNGKHRGTEVFGSFNDKQELKSHGRFPRSIQRFNRERGLHPTQKPVDLMAYLVRTYTNEGGTVLDFTMGSGSTGVACIKEGRNFIGIEKDSGYFDIARQRLEAAQ